MEQLLLLIVGLALVTVVVFIFRIWQQRTSSAPRSVPRPSPLIDMQTRDQDGSTVATVPEPAPPAQGRFASRVAHYKNLPFWQKALGALALIAFVSTSIWLLLSLLLRPASETYSVLVAPFNDGGDGRTGRVVAADLVRVLQEQSGGRMRVSLLNSAPADAQEVLTIALDRQADLIIWGNVQPGGLLDSPSLTPRLIYTPGGPYAPYAWAGYLGRFSMPRSFTIADEPINGQVVLPRLLNTLADYSEGRADAAFDEFGQLLTDYPLNPALPRALRGNILWARGAYGDAANEYRQALAQPTDEQARLANNLGVLLMDAGDGGALGAMTEARRLLDGRELGAWHFNMGQLAMRDGRMDDATAELEQARNLLPQNTPLLLALAEVYRETGRLNNAEAAISDAEGQIRSDAAIVPRQLRSLMYERLQSLLREQRALVRLARQVDAHGPLTWELEIAPTPPEATIKSIVDELRGAVQSSESLRNAWNARSTSDGARTPASGQVALGQARRVGQELAAQQYDLAIALVEQGRDQATQRQGFFTAMMDAMFGNGTPLSEGQTMLSTLVSNDPNNVPVLLADARALRLQRQGDLAAQRYDQAISLAPQRPEGYYGKGMVALENSDRDGAQQLLIQALDRDNGFFPARVRLAELAEQQGDWPRTLDQLRALADQRPGSASSLTLAAALRRSGRDGYAEAERVLNTLIATTPEAERAPALTELGRLYRDAGKLDSAAQTFQLARSIDSSAAEPAYELGLTLVAQDKPTDAVTQFRAAIANDTNQYQARMALADLYQHTLGQPDEATRLYEDILGSSINDAGRLITVGDALLINNAPDSAVKAFRKATDLQDGNALAHHRLAQAYLALKDLRNASFEEQRALIFTEGVPGDEARILRAAALVGLGDIERLRGNLDGAIERYNEALTLNTVQVDAALGLGLVAVGQGNWAVALSRFETAMSYPDGPQHPMAQFWLAEALLRQNDLPRAVEHYRAALAMHPRFPEAYLGLAQAQYAAGQRDEAAATLEQALQLRPQYAEGLLFKGKMLQEQGQLEDALRAYSSSISANGRIAETHYRRGLLYAQQQDYSRAIRDLQEARSLQPNFAEASYWIGRSYFAQQRWNDALGAFQQAVDLQGGVYAEARLYQGLTEEALGQLDRAAASFQAVLQLDSNGAWGNLARTGLERLANR